MIGVEHVGFVIYHTILVENTPYWSGKVDWFLCVPVKLKPFSLTR